MPNLVSWTDIAEDRAENTHNPKLYLGAGLISSLIVGSILNPATAIACLAWGLYMAWDANEKNSDQVEAVEEGIVAHLLDRKQLRRYKADVGREQVAAELKMALDRELKLSTAATELATRWNLKPSEEPEPQPEPDPLDEPKPEPPKLEKSDDSIEVPVIWQTVHEPPDMVQVWPQSQGDHPITQGGSADQVMREPSKVMTSPESGDPSTLVDPVALMAQTPFETVGPIRTDEFQLFSILKGQRRTQSDCIKILYHVAKGGTDAYSKARNRYLVLLKQYCDVERN